MAVQSFLADVIVVVHAAYVSFVVLGLVAVLMGARLGWGWIRNFWFRMLHLAMIGIVALQALCNIRCPLTVWEDQVRRAAGESVQEGSFIGRCVHQVLFYDAPPWVFTMIYCLFGGVVLAAFVWIPPRRPRFWWLSKRAKDKSNE